MPGTATEVAIDCFPCYIAHGVKEGENLGHADQKLLRLDPYTQLVDGKRRLLFDSGELPARPCCY